MTPIPSSEGPYADLLGEAAAVAAKAVKRLHDLHDRYPSAVLGAALEQLERAQIKVSDERRVSIRLPENSQPVMIRQAAEARVLDRSIDGISLRLDQMLLPGAILSIRLPGSEKDEWYTAQVRHCRPDAGEWIVGCEFQGKRPAF